MSFFASFHFFAFTKVRYWVTSSSPAWAADWARAAGAHNNQASVIHFEARVMAGMFYRTQARPGAIIFAPTFSRGTGRRRVYARARHGPVTVGGCPDRRRRPHDPTDDRGRAHQA